LTLSDYHQQTTTTVLLLKVSNTSIKAENGQNTTILACFQSYSGLSWVPKTERLGIIGAGTGILPPNMQCQSTEMMKK